ncbi:hypothetical protein GF324_14520 [bacterium]|nr:hypothetical protein [bacterium]
MAAAAKRVVIIGGDAAGLKTAARLRRLDKDAKIDVLERGHILSYAACGLPYFLSGDVDSFQELVSTAWGDVKDEEFFRLAKGIETHTGHAAVTIDRERNVLTARKDDGSEVDFPYDVLVIAVGAEPYRIEVQGCDLEGVQCFTRPEEAKQLRRGLETGGIGRVAVIGAGYIGLELCEAFGALWGAGTVLVEKENQVLPRMLDREMARLVEQELVKNDVELRLNCTLTRIRKQGEELVVVLSDGTEENVDRVIFAPGVHPRTDLAEAAGLKIGPHGGILVDNQGRTSDPSIFAAGDCAELPFNGTSHLLPLGSIANRMGRVVANVIHGLDDQLPRLFGSAVVKVFDLNVAVTGKTARALEADGVPTESYWGSFPANAHYFPESTDVFLKMVNAADGRLRGLQAVGAGEVVRWVDAFAQILDLAEGNPEALARFEHAYAPPFATAMDPFHHFYSMIEAGPDLVIHPEDLRDGGEARWTVLNLLNEKEAENIEWPEMRGRRVDIPINDLREHLDDLPDRDIVAVCARGTRSYEATVLLRNHNKEACYLGGGVRMILS